MDEHVDCCSKQEYVQPPCLCNPIELPRVHEYYIQPKKPKPIKPQTMYYPSPCRIPDLTIYKSSYMPIRNRRLDAFYPVDNLSLGEGKMSSSTVTKLSYQARKMLIPCLYPECDEDTVYEELPVYYTGGNKSTCTSHDVMRDDAVNIGEHCVQTEPCFAASNTQSEELYVSPRCPNQNVPTGTFLDYENEYYYLPPNEDNYCCLRCCRSKSNCE